MTLSIETEHAISLVALHSLILTMKKRSMENIASLSNRELSTHMAIVMNQESLAAPEKRVTMIYWIYHSMIRRDGPSCGQSSVLC